MLIMQHSQPQPLLDNLSDGSCTSPTPFAHQTFAIQVHVVQRYLLTYW